MMIVHKDDYTHVYSFHNTSVTQLINYHEVDFIIYSTSLCKNHEIMKLDMIYNSEKQIKLIIIIHV